LLIQLIYLELPQEFTNKALFQAMVPHCQTALLFIYAFGSDTRTLSQTWVKRTQRHGSWRIFSEGGQKDFF